MREERASDGAVIFLHIGKTAGSTLRTILHRNVPASRRLLVQSAQRLDSLRPRRENTLRDFAALPEERRRAARLIEGHVIFGIHESVPGPSTYITLLRDPVSLVISQYRYVLRTPTHRLHELVTSQGLSLADYVRAGVSLETDNSQTRAISGDVSAAFGECSDAMLEAARSSIEQRFSVVGFTERFDETLILLRAAFGWRKLCYLPVKVSPNRGRDPVPDDTMRQIRDQNRFDVELYRFAMERFQRAVAARPSFAEELAAFRRRQSRYRPWGYVTYTLPQRVYGRVRGRGGPLPQPGR
jgi:hypothetical protein